MWRGPQVTIQHRLSLCPRPGPGVLPKLHGVYNYGRCYNCRKQFLLNLVWCRTKHWLAFDYQKVVWGRSPSVVQLLAKPDINSHPLQLPLRPNVQALRYLNFRQFRTPSNFGNCHPWDFCLLTRGHFVLSKKTCTVSLRPKSERENSVASASWGGAVSEGPKYLINVDFVNGEVKHHHHEGYWVSSINFNNPPFCAGPIHHIYF